jgi:hypothetical protein
MARFPSYLLPLGSPTRGITQPLAAAHFPHARPALWGRGAAALLGRNALRPCYFFLAASARRRAAQPER